MFWKMPKILIRNYIKVLKDQNIFIKCKISCCGYEQGGLKLGGGILSFNKEKANININININYDYEYYVGA